MTGPGSFLGYPQPGMGYLLARDGVPQPEMGTPEGWGTPSQGWSTPWPVMGYPPPPDRTADGVLDTRQAVCLLRSRRRTFLFLYQFFSFVAVNIRLVCSVLFPNHFSAIRAQLGLKPLPIEKLPPTNMKRREHNTHTAKARVSHTPTEG